MMLPLLHRRRLNSARGQAMVEAALVMSLLVMVLLLTIDFGRAYFTHVSLRNAAREAAIYGGFHPLEACGTGDSYVGLRYEIAKEMLLEGPGGVSADWTRVRCNTGGDVQIVTATTDCYQFTAPDTYVACPAGPWDPTSTLVYRVELKTRFNPVSPLVGLLTGNGFGNAVPMSSVSSSPVMSGYGT